MEIITAQQAAEAAKGLTFEAVWAALMENRQQINESRKQMDESRKRMDEQMDESRKQMDESRKRMDERMDESRKRMDESQQRTEKSLDRLSKEIGSLGNTLGRVSEGLFSADLHKKFNELGFPFTKQGPHVKFYDNGKVLAEADFFLENGEYAMAVEVKTELKIDDVNDHMQRIAVIRGYFDERCDKRILIGAVAGVTFHDNVQKYAWKQGLYVITQSGDSITIADTPKGFKPREW